MSHSLKITPASPATGCLGNVVRLERVYFETFAGVGEVERVFVQTIDYSHLPVVQHEINCDHPVSGVLSDVFEQLHCLQLLSSQVGQLLKWVGTPRELEESHFSVAWPIHRLIELN